MLEMISANIMPCQVTATQANSADVIFRHAEHMKFLPIMLQRGLTIIYALELVSTIFLIYRLS